eukprot:g4536.t1
MHCERIEGKDKTWKCASAWDFVYYNTGDRDSGVFVKMESESVQLRGPADLRRLGHFKLRLVKFQVCRDPSGKSLQGTGAPVAGHSSTRREACSADSEAIVHHMGPGVSL